MAQYYLHKAKRCLKVLKENKDGIWVCENNRFLGKAVVDGIVLKIKLYEAYKPGGPSGTIPKNPNKYIIDIERGE